MAPGPTQLLIVAFLYLLPLVVLILAVRWAVTSGIRRARQDAGSQAETSAREALDRRYAEGEISREEYLEIKRDMTEEENAG